jgi:hypothetical protein
VEWINPHALIFLQSKNENGELETWTIQGASPVNFNRKPELKERLKAGLSVAVRVWPSRQPLYLDDTRTVLHTRPDDPKTSSRIVGGGQIRLSNVDVLDFGGGPAFWSRESNRDSHNRSGSIFSSVTVHATVGMYLPLVTTFSVQCDGPRSS